MGRLLAGELTARRLELENAMAELAELREQVAMAERSILDSDILDFDPAIKRRRSVEEGLLPV